MSSQVFQDFSGRMPLGAEHRSRIRTPALCRISEGAPCTQCGQTGNAAHRESGRRAWWRQVLRVKKAEAGEPSADETRKARCGRAIACNDAVGRRVSATGWTERRAGRGGLLVSARTHIRRAVVQHLPCQAPDRRCGLHRHHGRSCELASPEIRNLHAGMLVMCLYSWLGLSSVRSGACAEAVARMIRKLDGCTRHEDTASANGSTTSC